MAAFAFADELALYGPETAAGARTTLAQAEAYCRVLARRHYENFTVVSWLLPRQLRQHFCNVYAYCRWADDLADEVHHPARSLELLDWWAEQLRACYRREATHPVLVALTETIEQFAIPPEPFLDLLVAFRQDQRQTRYETFDQLLDYCRYSANPVGRLVLYLGRAHDETRAALSDSICTGLQLANHWQDVARDWQAGRLYLPREDLARYDVDESSFPQLTASAEFRRLMAMEVERAEQYLRAGLPLVELAPRELACDIWLFIQGGLSILQAIRRQDYDVWRRRPVVSRGARLWLLVGWLTRRLGRSS